MHKITLWQQILFQLILLLVGAFVLLPVWGLLRLALDGAIKSVPTDFRLLPTQWTLNVFAQVWKAPSQALDFLGLLRNSLVVAGGAALTAVAFGTSMAYAFARMHFRGRQVGLIGLLVGAMLPPVALMTPLYVLLETVHLRSTLFGLMIVYAAFGMPFCIWNMRSAFQSIPRELEEAAFLDGAGHFAAFWRVTLPLALPAIAVAALVAFLAGYSEFAIGWLFVERSQNVTLAMAVWGMRNQGSAPWSQISALALMVSVPVMIIFLLLRRTLLDRLLIGGMEQGG